MLSIYAGYLAYIGVCTRPRYPNNTPFLDPVFNMESTVLLSIQKVSFLGCVHCWWSSDERVQGNSVQLSHDATQHRSRSNKLHSTRHAHLCASCMLPPSVTGVCMHMAHSGWSEGWCEALTGHRDIMKPLPSPAHFRSKEPAPGAPWTRPPVPTEDVATTTPWGITCGENHAPETRSEEDIRTHTKAKSKTTIRETTRSHRTKTDEGKDDRTTAKQNASMKKTRTANSKYFWTAPGRPPIHLSKK